VPVPVPVPAQAQAQAQVRASVRVRVRASVRVPVPVLAPVSVSSRNWVSVPGRHQTKGRIRRPRWWQPAAPGWRAAKLASTDAAAWQLREGPTECSLTNHRDASSPWIPPTGLEPMCFFLLRP